MRDPHMDAYLNACEASIKFYREYTANLKRALESQARQTRKAMGGRKHWTKYLTEEAAVFFKNGVG